MASCFLNYSTTTEWASSREGHSLIWMLTLFWTYSISSLHSSQMCHLQSKFPIAFMACCKLCTENSPVPTLQDFSFYCCNWQCFVKYQQWAPYELHRPHSLSTHGIFYYQASSAGSLISYFCSFLFHFYLSILNASSNHQGFYQLVCNHLSSDHALFEWYLVVYPLYVFV